ncbi:hypothetical protein ABZY57_26185 [Streptomyces sp. NPDC006450]|uniref:hypothetical protein n=1 Tax=Streptomyces sp. NPDC006450 TaxID=3155458 RepID=UPI0033AA9568
MAVLAIGDAPTAAIEAAGLRIHTCRNDSDDPLPVTLTGIDAVLGVGSAPHGFRVRAGAWGLPVPDEADRELMRRFAELVARRAETTAT